MSIINSSEGEDLYIAAPAGRRVVFKEGSVTYYTSDIFRSSEVYNIEQTNALLNAKANKDDVYTSDEVNVKIANITIDLSDYNTTAETDANITSMKADLATDMEVSIDPVTKNWIVGGTDTGEKSALSNISIETTYS